MAQRDPRSMLVPWEVLLQCSADLLTVHDRDGTIVFANAASEHLLGRSPESLVRMPIRDLVHPDDLAHVLDRISASPCGAGPTRVGLRLRHHDGSYRRVESLVRNGLADPALHCLVVSTREAPGPVPAERGATRAEQQLASDWTLRVREASAEGIVCLDAAGRVTYMNPAASQVLGLEPAAAVGRPAHDLYHHSRPEGSPYPSADCPCLGATADGSSAHVLDEVFWRSDRTPVPVEYGATPLAPGQGSGAVQTGFQSAVLDSLPSRTAVVDRAGALLATNEAWNRHMRETAEPPADYGVGLEFADLCEAAFGTAPPGSLPVAEGLRALLAGETGGYQQDVANDRPGSETIHFSLQIAPLHIPGGGAVISYTDITARKNLEIDAAHRATHDVLTSLPNRVLLLERLEHALEHRNDCAMALLFLDLDSFKLVNDGYGHDAGDAVLTELATRLQANVRPGDTVARLAGDEFVVLCEDLRHVTEAHLLADRLIAAVSQPFALRDTSITLGVSIGIAVAAETDLDPAGLLRAADQAMFEAKAQGRNRFAIYDADIRGRNSRRLDQAMALRRMVEDDDLLVRYQPIVDLRDGRLTGSEALLRWRGDHDLPDTGTAITLAEEVGLIGRIGQFVVGEATRQAATFVTAHGEVLPLAINLAPQQLNHAFVGQLEQAAAAAAYPLTAMTLELTERTFIAQPVVAIEVLRALRRLGVRIALDDFGVGYSSLAALRDLPLDILKIDAGFVRGLALPRPDARLVRAVIQMAHALDLDVIAEGIETPDQRDQLLALGCLQGQGFFYSAACVPESLRTQAARAQPPG